MTEPIDTHANGADPVLSGLPVTWDRQGLVRAGFTGFVPLTTLTTAETPAGPGVYVIVRTSTDAPGLLAERPVTTAKQSPAYPLAVLTSLWVDGAEVIYIGKATSLRTRLSQYRRAGVGGTNHNGGRSIWQLTESATLLVAWRELSADDVPRVVESQLIAAFTAHHGARPFANRTR